MRERIKVSLCDEYIREVVLPGMHEDYRRGFEEMVLLNASYAVMLSSRGIISKMEAAEILSGLEYIKNNLREEELDPKLEDLHFNIESILTAKIGPVAGKLHTGRSRNDLNATLSRMEIRRSVWPLMGRLLDFQELLLKMAEENKETVITGYTHSQPAQPITYGYYLTAMASAFVRDFERLKAAYGHTNRCPYGAAAFAGSSFPVDRELLAELLGFDGILEHALDAVASRDYIAEMEAAFALLMTNVSRFAEDLYAWATYESGMLDFGGEIAICSSIMPQKKNPMSLEFARGKACPAAGALLPSLMTLKSAPYTNNGDNFEVVSLYWEGLKNTLSGLELLLQTVGHSSIRKERAYEAARTNYSTVTKLADDMAGQFGISFTQAHDIVGEVIDALDEKGLGIGDIDSSLIAKCSKTLLGYELQMSPEQIENALEPRRNIQGKVTAGGPSSSSVSGMIAHLKSVTDEQKSWLAGAERQVQNAYLRLWEKGQKART